MNEITITNTNGVLTVSSLQVAKDFGKQHKDVLEKITLLRAENSAVTSMFIESTYKAGTGKTYKCYDITRDGFSLLVMGFTGKKALEWKLKYIEAFNSMERQLTNINSGIEEYIDRVLDERIENIINRVLDEKMDNIVKIFDKNADRRTNSIIKAVKETVEKTSFETVSTLIPCFLYIHKKLKKLYKKIKK
ncbi:MAG: Rha family transcriptional regulator [Ruminococcus sp.]|nr:Rha family transcriptional regulator [Ruminococcus sp.]